ncbi:hypothetical protein ACE01N_07600 [Saccharicrinis sp. FJH2]|uniref:hypothetical protein n=1 Tax=Saccharicrinis sp. FJH65 TaxID=3344659 RepID=UPI0035F45027
MKKISLIIVLYGVIGIQLFSQESQNVKFSGKSGYGYFTNIFGIFDNDEYLIPGNEPGQPGQMMWMEYQYHYKENASVGLWFGSGIVKFTHGDIFDSNIVNTRVNDEYRMFGFNFYRYLNFKNSNLSVGVGPVYIDMKSPQISYMAEPAYVNGEAGYIYSNLQLDYYRDQMLGLNLDINYSYNVFKGLYAGVKCNTSVVMYYGLESFLLSPYLEFRF